MTPSDSRERPRLLAVGAFERDNFGDLLYVPMLEAFAGGEYDIELGAPLTAESPRSLGRPVRAWPRLLEEERFDAVWTVGGEVGATPPEYAFMTTYGADAYAELMALDDEARQERLRDAMGGHVPVSPYIPRPSAARLNAATPLVLNSVGLSGAPSVPAWRRHGVLATLREATHVSVRDRASSERLAEHEIPHDLAPDIVHAIARVRARPQTGHGALLVQLSDQALSEFPAEVWADALAKTAPGVPLRFFLAGTASGHDSREAAVALRELVRAREPSRSVTVSESDGIWDRVDEIAGAHAWIGTSLHGRIVASAYGVARVSIAKPKVDAYARDWDAAMPYTAVPEDLPGALHRALQAAESDDAGDGLADRAVAGVGRALAALDDERRAGRAGSRVEHRLAHAQAEAETLRAHGRRLEGMVAALRGDADTARATAEESRRLLAEERSAHAEERRIAESELDDVTSRLRGASSELAAIHSSRRWRMMERLDRLLRRGR